MTTTFRKLSYFLSLLAIVAIIGCGKKEKDPYADDEGGDKTPTSAMATVDLATGATINGTVTLDGGTPMPAPSAIKMDADPVCKAAHAAAQMDNFWMVGAGGGVENAFVYVKEGLGGKQYAAGADESDKLKAALTLQERAAHQQARAFAKTIGWALNLQGQYDFDQLPLGDETLSRMRELMARLAAADFRGQVRIATHVGEF